MEKIYKKRILFVGMPDMAIVCLTKLFNEGFNIVGVVPPHRSEGTYELMRSYADAYKIPLVEYEKSLDEIEFLHKVRQLDADLAIVCSYNKKFPPEFLKTTKYGFVNCHPSYLPNYRGANPYSHVLINDEKEAGITLHFMDENFDTGNIIFQIKAPMDKKETMGTLFNKMNYIAAELLTQFLKRFELNSNIDSVPQPQEDYVGQFKKAPAIDQKHMNNYIDWSMDSFYIERFVRALNPFISAMTSFRGVFVKIYTAEASDKKTKYEPGTICSVKDDLAVATGDGILYIKCLQYGSFMIADAKTFIEKFKPKVGEKLGI